MRKNLLTKALFALGAVALMASCAKNTDLYDQNAVDAQKKAEALAQVEQMKLSYAENFVKKYGAVDPNQSWDLTTGAKLGTRGANVDNSAQGVTTINASLVNGLDFTKAYNTPSLFYPNSLYNGITKVLPEGKTHKGERVVLAAPTCDFYIFPVITQCTWTHSLKVKVGTQAPYELYNKTWTTHAPVYNGKNLGTWLSPNYAQMKGIHIQAPIGTPIDVYLDNVKVGNTAKPSVGTFNGQAIFVSPAQGTNIWPGFTMKPNAVIKYIGIEDNTQATGSGKTDNDFNDVVLVLVGNPDIPGDIPVNEEIIEIPTNTCKRYMIEDLGADDDFDFNDIVVDVYQNSVKKWKKTTAGDIEISNEYLGEEVGDQEAIIRAMGGPLDFTLTIGSTKWTKSTGKRFSDGSDFVVGTMYNTQVGYNDSEILAKFKVSGWEPANNNISVEVVKVVKDIPTTSDNHNVVYEIPFPKDGDIPMIVAVDATVAWNWMNERVGVPAWWIKEELTEPADNITVPLPGEEE